MRRWLVQIWKCCVCEQGPLLAKRRHPDRDDVAADLLAIGGELHLCREKRLIRTNFCHADLQGALDGFAAGGLDSWKISLVARLKILIDDGDAEGRHDHLAKGTRYRSAMLILVSYFIERPKGGKRLVNG